MVFDVFLALSRQKAGELVLNVDIVAGAERAEGRWGMQEGKLGSWGGGGDQEELRVMGKEAGFGRASMKIWGPERSKKRFYEEDGRS